MFPITFNTPAELIAFILSTPEGWEILEAAREEKKKPQIPRDEGQSLVELYAAQQGWTPKQAASKLKRIKERHAINGD